VIRTKEATSTKKEATRRKVSVPYPEPGTERELLHNRRYVRENLKDFRTTSWWVTSMLPLAFTSAGSIAALHNLSQHSDPIAAVGAWAGAEGVVAVFSYLAMLAMFRGNKVPRSYLVAIGLATVAAVAVNVLVSPDMKSAAPFIAALAPVATAASVSAVFKVIKSCLDDAARVEFFELHKTEAQDLLRTNQLSRTPDNTDAQDETLSIVLSHTPSKKVADLMTRQVEGLVGTLGSSAPALEAPVPSEDDADEEVEAEIVPPLRVVENSRQAVMHPSEGRRAVLPEEGAAGKSVVTMKLPAQEPGKELEVAKAPTRVQRAKRELARIYWLAKLADRNLSDADFRRRFLTDFSQDLAPWAVQVLNPDREWERVGELRSSYLSKLKDPENNGYPVEAFLEELPELAALVKSA
jgi:hypothetical protein